MTHPTDSAFPVQRQLREDGEVLTYAEIGLTKREYFAAMAMQGILASESEDYRCPSRQKMAEDAAGCADALLAALAK
jgi:hypothetical protein